MLVELRIRNFTIIQALDLSFEKGMSVLTGETGAGKSVLIDAVELALGERADVRAIRQGESRCDISLLFDISNHHQAREWLLGNDLEAGNDCLVRRVLYADGRSRCYINDQAVSLQRVRVLGALLLTIHGQHHNQLLFDKSHQRRQLDTYLNCPQLLEQVQQSYQVWQKLLQAAQVLKQKSDEAQTKLDFLNYQLNELDLLGLRDGELEALESEQKKLAHAEHFLRNGQEALQKLASVEEDIFKTQVLLKPLLAFSNSSENISTLLEGSQIQAQEAQHELESYLETLSLNPEQLQQVEQRLSDIYALARKYRISPHELYAFQAKLREECEVLSTLDIQKTQLDLDIQAAKNLYENEAFQLSEKRRAMAKKMVSEIQAYLPSLGMAHAEFQIQLVPVEPCVYGNERVEFWMCTNPGQPSQPLEKIISGGELSRLNLAVQAVFTKAQEKAVLVFDEIDIGIGGQVAALVAQLICLLSENTQVIAITHLPQVVAKAHHHYVIRKIVSKETTYATMQKLSGEERALEIARMLGGLKITDHTMAHARELLESSL